MIIFNHQTQFRGWLKDLIFDPGSKHPKRCFWCGLDGWTSDPEEIIRALRLDDELSLAPNINLKEEKAE